MYLGSEFHRFWARSGNLHIHPDDEQFLQNLELPRGHYKRPAEFKFNHLPCPFDGPLESARIVICLANPKYDGLGGEKDELIFSQRSGNEPLPKDWDEWYEPLIAKRLSMQMDDVRREVAVLNVCPYESSEMNGAEISLAAGLPSVWAAQKYLREVLIPKALTKKIHLLVLRKHLLWGITEGWNCNHIHVERGHERDGGIPTNLKPLLKEWLTLQR